VRGRLRERPRRGLGYGLLRYAAQTGEAGAAGEARGRLAGLCGGQVLFNYLGQLDGAVGPGSMFRAARERAGAVRWGGGGRSHVLAVTAGVAGGRMVMTWGYSRGLHRGETVGLAAGWMAEELRSLVAGCGGEGVGGLAPSDFPLARLTQAQLDRLAQSRGGR